MSTLHVSDKTRPGVLLQPAALEDVVADSRKGKDETGRIGTASAVRAGVQHGRGETASAPVRVLQRHPSTASAVAGTGRELSAQPRVFVLAKDGKPLDPTTPRRARLLLKAGRAVVVPRIPFDPKVRGVGKPSTPHRETVPTLCDIAVAGVSGATPQSGSAHPGLAPTNASTRTDRPPHRK